MPVDLILWDWNGTLLDDVALCVDALNHLLAEYGYPQRYTLDSYREIFGFPVEEYYVRAGFDFSRHPFPVLAKSFMEDYLPRSASCPLARGARQALADFDRAGLRQVILSASRVEDLERQVTERGIRGCFDRLLGLGDIYAKSKVEVGRRFFRESGFDPGRAVMIGDSVHDFEVARAMGVRCVLQCAGHQTEAALRATGAPVVPGLPEAADFILGEAHHE